MTAIAPEPRSSEFEEPVRGTWCGVRMSAEEYFQIPDDGARYELIHGVIVMSPSPTPGHQTTAGAIFLQLATHVHKEQLGLVLYETDVQLGKDESGLDIVYRPEIVFYKQKITAEMMKRLKGPPNLAVEVISPHSRKLDSVTKLEDYEKAGVGEYWLIDPQRDQMHFYRPESGKLVESMPTAEEYVSAAVPGFKLDLKRIRNTFKAP